MGTSRTLNRQSLKVGEVTYEAMDRAPESSLSQLKPPQKDEATGLIITQYGCPMYRPKPVLRVYDPASGDFCWYVPLSELPR